MALQDRSDRFCPACFRTIGVVPAAVAATRTGGTALSEPWVYREHERATWHGDEARRERCAGSGRTEHEARQAW